MVNETILGGLKIAVSHKSSLKDAMQSFYNAGYDKAEVEEAAKIIFDEQTKQPKSLSQETKKIIPQGKTSKQPLKKQTQVPVTPEIKKKPSKKNLGLIILLVGILIILLGALVGLFIFKDKIF